MDNCYCINVNAIAYKKHFTAKELEEKAAEMINAFCSKIIFKELHEFTNNHLFHVYKNNGCGIPYDYSYSGSFFVRTRCSRESVDKLMKLDSNPDISQNGYLIWGYCYEITEDELKNQKIKKMIAYHDEFLDKYNKYYGFK